MKKILIVFLIFILPFSAFSQQVRIIKICVTSLENNNVQMPKSAYLTTQDTILEKVPFFNNEAVFYLNDKVNENETYLIIKHDINCFYRIKLKNLLLDEGCFQLPKAIISLIEDNTMAEKEIVGFHRSEIKTNYNPTKLWLDFSPEGQMRLNDTIRWFFPTENMLNVGAQKERILNSYYFQNYYNEFGRYPTESELDSLAKNMSISVAEELIGWYSWHLLRLEEKELCNDTQKDVYRFTMVSNDYFYTYEPYSLRIEPRENGTAVMYCMYEKYNECEEKSLFCDIVPFDEETLLNFQNILKEMRFWEAIPTENPNELYKTRKTNILEANINNQYHVIFRGENEDEGMEELRRFLWNLTGLGENKIVHRRQKIE